MSNVDDYAKMSDSAKKKEDWMNSKWRPLMGYVYMATCIADFVIFPILWSLIQVIGDGKVESQWMPITLQGAGLFHVAMGAILGIAAYGRTQEKLNDKAGSGMSMPTPSPTTAPAPSFGGTTLGNNTMSQVQTYSAPPAPKPSPFAGPAQPPHPEI